MTKVYKHKLAVLFQDACPLLITYSTEIEMSYSLLLQETHTNDRSALGMQSRTKPEHLQKNLSGTIGLGIAD